MERGEFVPDEPVVAVVAERIFRPNAREGFIFDGFPRTIAQAMALDDISVTNRLNLDCVVELRVDEEVLQTVRVDDTEAALKVRRRIPPANRTACRLLASEGNSQDH
jgi:adenylate kinase